MDNIPKSSYDNWYLENLFDTATVHKSVEDTNGDSFVSIDDFLHIIDNWQSCGKTLPQ